MLINHSKTLVMASLLAMLATACNDNIEVGGKCKFTDEKVLTRVVHNDDEVVELEPMYGELMKFSTQEFELTVHDNDYYEIYIRRHTSGGCNPYSITNKVKVTIDNVLLSPTEQQAYAASFILDEVKNCVYGQLADSCKDDLALDASFDLSQLSLLSHIAPRSVSHCSAAAMKTIWPEIESAVTQTRLISCVENLDGVELAVEFSLPDESTLLLRKVY